MVPVNNLESTLTVAYKEGTATEIALVAIANFPAAGGVVTLDDGQEWVIKVYGSTDVGNKKLQTLSNAVAVYASSGASGHTFAVGTEVWMTHAADYYISYVVGPASATDHALARFDGTTGKIVQNSGIIVNDTDDISGVHGLTATANLDIGAHDFRARNLTVDALTVGRLVYTGANGLLSATATGTWNGTTLGITGTVIFAVSSAATSQYTAGNDPLRLINTNTTNNNWVELYFADTTAGAAGAFIGARITDHTNNYAELHFSTKGSTGLATRLMIQENGNIGHGITTFGTNAAKVWSQGHGTAPTTSIADSYQIWSADVNAAAGYGWMHGRDEKGHTLIIAGVVIKVDGGQTANPHEGLIEINTNENKVYMYADAGWREVATW